jgi:hypothetical protein
MEHALLRQKHTSLDSRLVSAEFGQYLFSHWLWLHIQPLQLVSPFRSSVSRDAKHDVPTVPSASSVLSEQIKSSDIRRHVSFFSL